MIKKLTTFSHQNQKPITPKEYLKAWESNSYQTEFSLIRYCMNELAKLSAKKNEADDLPSARYA